MLTSIAKSDFKNSVENIIIQYASTIIGLESEEAVLWNLAKNCIGKLGFEDCVIYKADHENKVLVQKAAHGPKNPDGLNIYAPIKIPFGEGITGHVVLSGKSEIVNNTSNDPRYIVDDSFRNSEMTIPIIIKEKVWGVIDCENYHLNFFTKKHLEIVEALASICGVKIARIEAEKALATKQDSLQEMQKSLLEMRVDSFKSQINPHFTFNALNAIQFFITNDDKAKALKYQSLFSKLLRKYLLHISDERNQVEEEIRMLNWYLTLQQMRYEDRFEFDIKVEESLYPLKIPTFLIQLLIEEEVETTVMSNRKVSKISIDINYSDQIIIVKVNHIIDSSAEFKREDDNYRIDHFSWVNYVELLNKLNRSPIVFSHKTNNLTEENMTEKLTELRIPIE